VNREVFGNRKVNSGSRTEGATMNQDLITAVEERHLRDDRPDFRPGDTLRVNVRVVEGNRERIQAVDGTCIAHQGGGTRETVTVRRISQGIGVERCFPVHSRRIESIEVRRQGKVRRAKLYYLRGRIGSRAIRIKERAHKR